MTGEGEAYRTDDPVPFDDVSDAALEIAAGTIGGKAAALTISFCSGLDSCPS